MATIKINFTFKRRSIFRKKTLISFKRLYLIKILHENMTLNNVFIMSCWGMWKKTKGYLGDLRRLMCVWKWENGKWKKILTFFNGFHDEASYVCENLTSSISRRKLMDPLGWPEFIVIEFCRHKLIWIIRKSSKMIQSWRIIDSILFPMHYSLSFSHLIYNQ